MAIVMLFGLNGSAALSKTQPKQSGQQEKGQQRDYYGELTAALESQKVTFYGMTISKLGNRTFFILDGVAEQKYLLMLPIILIGLTLIITSKKK